MKFSVVTPLWQDRPAAENLEVAINADRLGFPELWIGEMATYDAFAFATAVGYETGQIALTLGPLAVSVRSPMTMAMGIASVADLTGRQTNLALGASSVVVVEEWHGQERKRTASHLAETAQIVRGLLDGDKVTFEGELASCKGYHLRLDAPKSSLTVAAFGPAAVRTAARHSDRMLLNMVTPQSLARLRSQMEEAAEKADRPTPRLAVWLTCAVEPERSLRIEARPVARRQLAGEERRVSGQGPASTPRPRGRIPRLLRPGGRGSDSCPARDRRDRACRPGSCRG